jgi:cytoskeletal protein RodZ
VNSPTLIGSALREARMAKGLDITECSRAIHVRARYLTAIEDGRFDDLPSPAYVAGFVRAYADHLGVDLDGFAEPERELPVLSEPVRRPRPVSLTATRTHRKGGGRVRWLAWMLVIVIAIALIVLLAIWLGVWDGAGPVAPRD